MFISEFYQIGISLSNLVNFGVVRLPGGLTNWAAILVKMWHAACDVPCRNCAGIMSLSTLRKWSWNPGVFPRWHKESRLLRDSLTYCGFDCDCAWMDVGLLLLLLIASVVEGVWFSVVVVVSWGTRDGIFLLKELL